MSNPSTESSDASPVKVDVPSELPKKVNRAESQEKDTVIRKLKERIKSLSGNKNVENVKKEIDEIETINIELEHSVAKLFSENENLRNEREHLKSIYKDQFDSIKKTRVQSKEHSDSLIAQINAKSVEKSNLNAQLHVKVFAITALKDELRKLKGKGVVDYAVSKPNAVTIAPGMFKLNLEPLALPLVKNKDAHIDYIKHTRDKLVHLGYATKVAVKSRKEVANQRCLSHSIRNLTLGSRRARKGDLRMREEVVTWKLYLGLAFTIPTLERVTIGCCEVDGGCGGCGEVFGGSVVFSGDGVGVIRRRSAMGRCRDYHLRIGQGTDIHDDCKGTRERLMVWYEGKVCAVERCKGNKGIQMCEGGCKRHNTSVECFVYYMTQGHVTIGFELHCHRGDQDVDAKGNDYYETIWIKINGAFIISGEFTYRNKVFNYIGCDKNIFKVEWAIWIGDLYMSRVGDRGEELVMREKEGEDYGKIKNLALITMKDNRN
nr:hypothetical protein [Tanacetum cinerariifolium]